MTYVDTSVVLAHVLAEDVRPSEAFWALPDLVSSRLAEFEAWVRLHAYGRARTHGPVLAATLARLDLLGLDEQVCARCRAPFPVPVRTLDALHLASADFFRSQGFTLDVATYDGRLGAGAIAMGFALVRW